MRDIVWALSVALALPCGALAWEVVRLRHFLPDPPIVPVKIVKYEPVPPSRILKNESCVEQARTSYAQCRSAKVKPK